MTTVTFSAPSDRLVTLPDGLPELTLGWEALRWASKYLRHPNGPRAGERWLYTPSQARFLLWWYAVDEDGGWLFHHAARRLAKGSGKSPAAGAFALTEFLGPVRIDDMDPSLPGGCKGRSVDMALVQIAATAESQTANTMRMVRAMAQKGSRLAAEYDLDVGKTRYYAGNGSMLETITSSATAAEGAEVTAVVADETEHWLPSSGGPELMDTLDRNLAKSGNRMLETANAWEPGIGSVAEATWDAWVAQEEGRLRGESRILYDARMAPASTDLSDEASLRSALEFVYDDCFWVDLKPILARIWSPRTRPDVSRRFYLNQPTAAEDAWVTPSQVHALSRPGVTVDPGEDVALFFDGSKSSDATALVGCRVSDGHVFTVGVWERPPGPAGEDWTVPSNDVDRAVEAAFATWSVRGFFADVREFEGYVKTTWPQRYGEDLPIWAQPGGKEPGPIAWDMRGRTYEFTAACELAFDDIVTAAFTTDGHPALVRHLINARRRPNRYGVGIGKESRDSPRKIDAAVCLVGARMVRRLVLAKQAESKPRSGEAFFF